MTRVLIALLVLLAGTAPALAQVPVTVTADQFTVEESASEAVFTGNVKIVRTGLTVWAERVVVQYGEGGIQDIESFTATGRVRLKTDDQDATGDRAVFDPAAQLLRLTGNVVVTNEAGQVSGPDLVVNLKDNSSVFSGGKGGRVTGVFKPQ